MSSVNGVDLAKELISGKNSSKTVQNGQTSQVGSNLPVDSVQISGGVPVQPEVGNETFSQSGLFMKLHAMLTEMFSKFAEKSGLQGGGSPQQEAMYAVEGSFRASLSIQYSETHVSRAANGYTEVERSRSFSVQAEVEVRVSEYKKTAEQAPMDLQSLSNYFSPNNTADRIANFAFSFYPMFRQDHPEMSDEEAVEAFREMATKAIDKGMSEALQILGELPDEISQMIDETHDQIFKKLDELIGTLITEKGESN